jgi:hypothetical protein
MADRDKVAAVALLDDEGYKAALQIADDLVRDFESQALSCEDEKETVRLMGEARGARHFRDQLLHTLEAMAK